MQTALLFIIGFIAIFLFYSIKIVPQGQEWIVERLGKFEAVLSPGPNIIIPFLDKVRYKVTTKDIILDVPEQEVITKDNAVILANAVAFIKVTNIEKAVYGIENFKEAMRNMVQTSLRSIIGGMELNEALSSRDKIKALLKQSLLDEASDWGLTLKSVEIQDIKPSPNMQKAMEQQASAERERVAVVTKAEGAKQAAILEAEARLAAAKLDAEGQNVAAKASAISVKTIADALDGNLEAGKFLLGDRYIQTLSKLSTSDNAKVVLMPGDLGSAIKSMIQQNS